MQRACDGHESRKIESIATRSVLLCVCPAPSTPTGLSVGPKSDIFFVFTVFCLNEARIKVQVLKLISESYLSKGRPVDSTIQLVKESA